MSTPLYNAFKGTDIKEQITGNFERDFLQEVNFCTLHAEYYVYKKHVSQGRIYFICFVTLS